MNRLNEILRRSISWEGLGLLILFWVLFVNRFPDGFIILGADILQPINMTDRLAQFHYAWSGRVSLFYGFIYFLDRIGISDTAQISWYLGVFLVGAYASFLAFVRIIFPTANRLVGFLAALFYALNPFTLYVFTATWGYSHYQIVYIFIPILTALYIRTLSERAGFRMLLLFLLATFFASGSFGNPAFALALGIYFILLTTGFVFLRLVPCDRVLLRRVVFAGIGAFLLNLYWVLPLLPQMRAGIESVYTSEYVDLSERLKKTSNAIFDTVRLLPTSEQSRYFPGNFPYPNLNFLKEGIYLLTFAPFFLILLSWLKKSKERNYERYRVLFLIMLLVFIILVARVRFPFETLNTLLFELPGLNTLRGWDKMATLVPFLVSTLVLISLSNLDGKWYRKYVLIFFALIIFSSGLPFFAGGIQTNLSYILSGQKAKNFESAKQSALVQIPDDYYQVAAYLNRDEEIFKIAMLPYSPGSSVGRVSLPVWKVNGPHPMHALSRHQFLEANDSYLSDWQFGKDLNSGSGSNWIAQLYGLLGVKYILYQKDAKPESLADFEGTILSLERSGELVRVLDTNHITLYKLAESRLFPPAYLTSAQSSVTLVPESVSLGVENLRQSLIVLPSVKINEQRLRLPISKLQSGQRLFLSERFDPLWEAEYLSDAGSIMSLSRDTSVRYANAWKVEHDMEGGSIILHFAPERYLIFGEFVSGIVLIMVCFGLFRLQTRSDNLRTE